MAAIVMAAGGSSIINRNREMGKELQKLQPCKGDLDSDDEWTHDWCFISQNGVEESPAESHPMTVDQIVQEVSNCISKELLHNADDELLSDTVDEIFKTFQEVAEIDLEPLTSFLISWYEQNPLPTCTNYGMDTRKECTVPDHTIIIKLMVKLLRVSPDPEQYHLLWLKILTHFILITSDLTKLVELKVAATILGTMAAYSGTADIQLYGCMALQPLATIKPTPTQKAPVKESAIHVLSQTLQKHSTRLNVLHAACHLIATIASTMTHVHTWSIQQGFSADDIDKLCTMANDVLCCIKEATVPRLEMIAGQHPHEEKLITDLEKIWACFGCHSNLGNSSIIDLESYQRQKSHSFPGTVERKRVTFSQHLDIVSSEIFFKILKKEEREHEIKTRSLSLNDIDLLAASHKLNPRIGDQNFKSVKLSLKRYFCKEMYGHSREASDGGSESEQLEYETADESKGGTITRNSSTSGSYYSCSSSLSSDNRNRFLPKLQELPTEKEVSEQCKNCTPNEHVGNCYDQNKKYENVHVDSNCRCSMQNVDNMPDLCKDTSGTVTCKPICEENYDKVQSDFEKFGPDAETFGIVNEDSVQRECDEKKRFSDETLCGSCTSVEDHCDSENGEETGNIESETSFLPRNIKLEMEDSVDFVPDNIPEEDDCEGISSEYAEYNEIDIVEALVRAGLMSEEKAPSIHPPPFPVLEDELWNDQCVGGSDEGGYTTAYVTLRNEQLLSSEADGSVRRCTNFQNLLSKWRRVSEYGNIETEDMMQCEVNNNNMSEEQHMDAAESLTCTTKDLNTIQEEANLIYNSGEDRHYPQLQNFCNCGENFNEGCLQGGSFHKDRYRMSVISVLHDDLDELPWQENAAFASSCGESSATEDSMTITSGEFCISDEDSQLAVSDIVSDLNSSQRISMYSEFTGDQSITEVTESDDTTSTFSCGIASCSSGSYTIQDIGFGNPAFLPIESLNDLTGPGPPSDNSKDEVIIRQSKTLSSSDSDAPPKPRRTWYYQSSSDVRRSLVRSFGVDMENDPNQLLPPASDGRGKSVYLQNGSARKHISSSNYVHPTVSKSGTTSSNDSGVVMNSLENKVNSSNTSHRSTSHLYEEVSCSGTSNYVNIESQRKTVHLEEHGSEATYKVCTLWVNGELYKALEIFDQLTKALVSPYSIVPVAREAENRKRRSSLCLDDVISISPAWTNILDVLASDESKWTLSLSALVLPIVDRLFGMRDKHILDSVIELVQMLIKKHGKDVEKNHHPSLFKTRYREDCRTCYTWLGKLYTRSAYLLDRRDKKDNRDLDNLLHISLLSSFFEALKPYTQKSGKET